MFRLVCVSLLAVLPVLASAPLLQVTATPDAGGFQVSAENPYSAAATEFVVRVTYWLAPGSRCAPARTAPDGRCWTSFSRHAIMTPGQGSGADRHPAAWLIQPTESKRLFRVGARAVAIRSSECLAVIYDDGASAGDEYLIRKMLLERKHNLDDAQDMLRQLSADLSQPTLDLNNLTAAFASQDHRHQREIESAIPSSSRPDPFGLGDDQICSSLRAQFNQAAAAGANPAQTVKRAMQYLKAYIAMMQARRPALQ